MKIKFLLPLIIIASFVSACGKAAPTPISPSAEEIFNTVYTMVAQTSAAQHAAITPQVTSTPMSSTPTLFIPTATFFPTVTAVSYMAAYNVCDSSVYVSDATIPDGTVFAPGTTFTKTWEIRNTGTCSWNEGYSIVFTDGKRMSGEDTSIDQAVSPDETAEISVELTSPIEEGTYTGYWILTNKYGIAFGNYVYVQIVVSDNAATSTPAVTLEATATPANTIAPTLIPTETPTPVSLPTETPAPIGTPTPTPVDLPTTRPRS